MSIDLNLDKADVEILYLLHYNKATSPIFALSVKELMDRTYLEASYHTFLRKMNKKLKDMDLLEYGYKFRNSNTFYLTQKGIEYVENVILKNNNLEKIMIEEELEEEN